MMVDTAQIMPITQLQKTLTQTVRKISEDKQPVFIMKNNAMEAVMMSFDRYEKLAELEELEEQKEIYSMVQERMSHYDASKNVSWSSLRDK
ncbi:type II toxin-antitoxin system Phd/YefM family antitoxin [Treponema zioleckii]|uniref:type II toxin-antitoxin system Phd/YefM family antitoxin n=1 Tax=Treponema zioleckii TaxID=331680 RepID=UPI00168B2E91|nr:type II toxin-antitoxin system Phd/YefM family antitoxin [Treponema zioleckii]